MVDDVWLPCVVSLRREVRLLVKPDEGPKHRLVLPVPDVVAGAMEDHRLRQHALQSLVHIVLVRLGCLYIYTLGGRTTLLGYAAKQRTEALHCKYRDDEHLKAGEDAFWSALERRRESVLERRKARMSGHRFAVGDIVYNSWGYDQTNVDWYKVVRVSKCYVWLGAIGCNFEATAWLQGKETPRNETPQGKPEKHRATRDAITFRHGCGSKWTGKPVHSSSYH